MQRLMQLPYRFVIFGLFLLAGCSDQPATENAEKEIPAAISESADRVTSSELDRIETINQPVTTPPEIPMGRLIIPVADVEATDLNDMFTDPRSGGRVHDAIDIMAPTGTPIFAAAPGKVAKLFLSDKGGKTIYHTVTGTDYMLYYAHLDAYADGLKEGQQVQRGDILGYVGATGNANPNGPHLHFAVHKLDADRSWWKGTPVNPYPYLTGALNLPRSNDAR